MHSGNLQAATCGCAEHTADSGRTDAADGGHLQGRRIAIMPHKCKTIDEWTARYAGQKDR